MMITLKTAVLSAFTCAALAPSAPAREPVAAPASTFTPRIVVLGSSTAARAGARPSSMAWVDRYETYLKTNWPGSEVVNRAVGGYTTYHLMPTGFTPPAGRPAPVADRNITYALAQKPDAIIVNLPSNDAAIGATVEEQQNNYRVMADLARAAGVPLWVSTTAPRNMAPEKRENQRAVRDWTLQTFGPYAIDFYTDLAEPDGSLSRRVDSGDGVHLNNVGHALLFQRVAAKDIPYTLARCQWSK